jgi:hypothetical protein
MTPSQIGKWMTLTEEEFADPIYLEVDYSRWDAHLGLEALGCELGIYERMGFDTQVLKTMRRLQFQSVGRTKRDVIYTVNGTRKSGDPNTSVGNSLLNGLINAHCLSKFGKFKLMVLGDDMVAAIERQAWKDESQEAYIGQMVALGLKPEIQVHMTPHKVSFCSSYFYPCEVEGRRTHILAPKAGRCLSKFGYQIGVRTRKDPQTLLGIALGLAPQGYVVPGLNSYIRAIQSTVREEPIMPGWYRSDGMDTIVCRTVETEQMVQDVYGMSWARLEQWAWRDRQNFVDHCLACE